METKKWARKAFAAHPKGWLHKHLHVPIEEHLPRGFLNNIEVTTIGKYAYNPTKIGVSKIKVTVPIKREAVAILNINPPEKHKK